MSKKIVMPKATVDFFSKIELPLLDKVIEDITAFDKEYKQNSHNANCSRNTAINRYAVLCKEVYLYWYKFMTENKDKFKGEAKTVAEILFNTEELNPNKTKIDGKFLSLVLLSVI